MTFLRPFIFFFSLLLIQTAVAQESYKPKGAEGDYVLLHDSLLTGDYRELHLADLKGWKFNPKDDPSYSQSSLNDEDWFRVPGVLSEENAVPDSLWNGFGWFRLKVKVDPTFPTNIVLENYVTADGALELYINDSLIFKKGNPSFSKDNQILQANKMSHRSFYEFKPGEIYQLAVKYSFHDYNLAKVFTSLRPQTDLGIHIIDRDRLSLQIRRKNIETIIFSSILTILFMVMILHLFLHLKTTQYSTNFWIFLITALIFFFVLLIVLETHLEFSLYPLKLALVFLLSVSMSLILGFLPLVIHKVLDVTPGKIWKYFTIVPLLFTILIQIANTIIQVPRTFDIISGIVLILLVFYGGSRAIIQAKKKKYKGLYLIAGSFLGFPLLLLLGMVLFEVLKVSDSFSGMLLFASFLLIIPVGMSLYQGKKFLRMHTQLDNMVEERTLELEEAMANLQQSHSNLKAAQDQLVQQEKLASLGQLTAGIAHEIKNPLNFVTNFSDVCLELIEEAKSELKTLKKTEVPVGNNGNDPTLLGNLEDLLDTVEVNLQKIYQHGNRADGIVKSMLLHSRGGSGKKEPTDLNHLVKEYVNLAFHGMRASRNPINVKIELELEEQIGKVPLIAEDFSRVILNLCNNAFDAMREKSGNPDYTPILNVSTRKENNRIIVSIKDNGPGIKQEILNNILQPFFTTKKGTDGTGLGLSLSNEIVKAHSGEIKIESTPGAGATLKIVLPINNENISVVMEGKERN